MFKEILVPFDGSEHSIWALHKAIELGKIGKSKIYVYHAIKHNFRRLTAFSFPFLGADEDPLALSPEQEEAIYESHKRLAERILEEAKKILELSGLDYELDLIENASAVDAAIELTETRDIDLVVVGARGVHGLLERLVIGSVSTAIVNKVCTNVLVVRTECKS